MINAIDVKNMGFAYTKEQWIFRDLNFSIAPGSVFAILGPNGKGKTTLLKSILGLLSPQEGSVILRGQSAFVPQLFSVTFAYSVLDMVVMGRAKQIGLFSQPSKADYGSAYEALKRFGLEELAERPFSDLSGGQRQLVIIARALVAEAQILILDEPTSALDLKNQELILQWIHRLSKEEGLTILFTTHHPHHALSVADHALLMFEHDDYTFGTIGETLCEENLMRLYGIAIKHLSFEHDGKAAHTLTPVFMKQRK